MFVSLHFYCCLAKWRTEGTDTWERLKSMVVEKVVRVPDFFSHFIIFVLFDDILDDPQSYFRCANRKMSGGVPD